VTSAERQRLHQRALTLKVLAGFEAAARKKRELARLEGPNFERAVEISNELFEAAWPGLRGAAYERSRERLAAPVRALYRELYRRAQERGRGSMAPIDWSALRP
jgi:hypothetical protein